MPTSANSLTCPPFIQSEEQHRRAITQWMMRVSPTISNLAVNAKDQPFNATGDTRRMSTTLTINNGSSSLTAPSAAFSAGDVGKAITLHWPTGAFTSSVLSVSAATAIYLTNNATMSLSAAASIATVGTDDYSALQAAIVHCQIDGKTLYIPAGWYTLGNQLSATDYLTIVGDGWKCLRGIEGQFSFNWATSPAHGTVLFSNFFDTDHSAGLRVSSGQGAIIKDIEFEMVQPLPINGGTGWTSLNTPWSIKLWRNGFSTDGGDHTHCENIMLRNSAKGIRCQGTSRPSFNNIFGQCFVVGLYMSGIYDTTRLENIHLGWPFFDGNTQVMNVQAANCDAIIMGRVDNPMLTNVFAYYTRTLLKIFNSSETDIVSDGFTERLQGVNIGADQVQYGIWIWDNATLDLSNFYCYCRPGLSAGVGNSYGIWAISAAAQDNVNLLNLSNVDFQGAYGECIRLEVPTMMNVANMRLRNFNLGNTGACAIRAERSSTCNVVNVIDQNPGQHFSTSLFEAVTGSIFHYVNV